MAIALIASLGITLPALGTVFQLPVLKSIPSPLSTIGDLPDPGNLLAGARSWLLPQESERAKVLRVVDGDTLVVRVNGQKQRVRLIGIDTSESVKRNTPVQCYAKAASSATRRRLEGRRVKLIYDRERTDKYDRTLAYVERKGRDHGAWMLSRGYARTLSIKPNIARASKYRKLQKKAQRSARGVWSQCKGSLSWVK